MTLPVTFEWRGTQWLRGLGTGYYPVADEKHIGLRFRNGCVVWYEESESKWRAALVPHEQYKSRSGFQATPGSTPQEALDGEVAAWLMTAFALPGAREIFLHLALFSADLMGVAESPKSPG